MKKLFVLLSAVLLFAALAVASSAHSTYIVENDPVELAGSTPTVDGTIADNEGWSAAARLDNDTAGFFWDFFPMTAEADLYFAVDDDNLYFAAVISDPVEDAGEGMENHKNGFIISDDIDYANTEKVDGQTRYPYGWNGDVITLMLDPGRKLAAFDPLSLAPWYNVGLFYDEADSYYYVRVYRSKVNEAEITDVVTCAGGVVADGWTVEVALPLEMIAQDVSDITGGELTVTAEDLNSPDRVIAAAAMYMDRYIHPVKEEISTWGRFITVCKTCEDGTPGYMTSGVAVKAMGLTLHTAGEHSFGDWKSDKVADCLTSSTETRVCSNCGQSESREIAAIGKHSFGEWIEQTPPHIGENGVRRRVCEVCGKTDYENIPMLLLPDDVKENAWYTEGVVYCINNRYMTGVSETLFAPNMVMTRAQFVTILSKIDGADTSTYEGTHFKDVPEGKWFSKPIEWAYSMGYAGGTGNGNFSPNAGVTRETLAQFLYTYSVLNVSSLASVDLDASADLSVYADFDKVSGWAKDALSWAVGAGYISGVGNDMLSPRTFATRAQTALIISKYDFDKRNYHL